MLSCFAVIHQAGLQPAVIAADKWAIGKAAGRRTIRASAGEQGWRTESPFTEEEPVAAGEICVVVVIPKDNSLKEKRFLQWARPVTQREIRQPHNVDGVPDGNGWSGTQKPATPPRYQVNHPVMEMPETGLSFM